MCCKIVSKRADGSSVTVLCVDEGEIEPGKLNKGYRTKFLLDDGVVLISDFVPPAGERLASLAMARMAHDDEVLERAGIQLGEDVVDVDCIVAHALVATPAA
jgi:hypothetical protein